MTDIQLIGKLIEAYSKGLSETTPFMSKDEVSKHFNDRWLGCGVCYAAWNLFKHDISKKTWVSQYIAPKMIYWTRTPLGCSTGEETIDAVDKRLTLLKELYEYYSSMAEKSNQGGTLF